ncbi:protoheme IX farnesyltransferase [Catenovulum sp. SM1970]|uniref:heme o synthase n=1 Tax=Marinifaba aquimaris TaxID=2741323 RepID=UPI001571F0FE|nr:heme o synthase [Marinifaba aquimaris]NTS76520.1 protoheme IX farnesyltransferase [Marinifaba aquimaris]
MAKSMIMGASRRFHYKDYLELTKPKVVLLILLTALVGMVLASAELPSFSLITASILGIGSLSGAAAVINHVVDQKVDSLMARTYQRPIARGRVTSTHALCFAILLACFGFTILVLAVNWLTAWLTFASLVGYAFIYTLYLKRATPQNIVIGGLAGAMPPLLGWTAVTNQLDPNALLLVMIIFTWTPPHFWALAIHREKDYSKAKIPMLPVTHGIEFTKTMVVLYSAILFLVCLLPWLVGMVEYCYLIACILLNGRFLQLALRLKRQVDHKDAFKLFKFSIIHLMLLFIALMVDHFIF